MVNLGRLLALFAVVLYTGVLSAQQPDSTFWVPNGPVNALVLHDTTVILGGDFDLVTPFTGSFVRIDTATAETDPNFFKVNGTVYATCTDAAGNIYVGGSFTTAGRTSANNIFRMRPDGSFDHSFVHNVTGTVYCLAVHDTSLFLGGEFTTIDGETRNNFGSVALNTGLVTEFNPDVNGPVYTCALDAAAGTMVIGGDFNHVGNYSPPFLAKVYLYDGAVVASGAIPWTATPNIDGPVYDVEVTEYRCWVAGDFEWAGTIPRRGLAVLLKSDGTLLAEDAQLDGPVYAIHRTDTMWYIGGDFTSVDGQPRSNVAYLNWSLNVQPWNPGADDVVRAFYSIDHDRLFVGGDFAVFGGDSCSRGAIVHKSTSIIVPWNPTLNDVVYTAVVDDYERLYIGGAFFGAGGVRRHNLCAISINTGRATAWNPDVNAAVRTLTLDGDALYLAGDFTNVGTTPRVRIGAIDLLTANVLPFNPGCNGLVRTIAVTDSAVYAGGNFTSIGGQPRNNIGKLNKTTGTALNWNPNCLGTVNSILATSKWIYVSGFFSTIGGQSRMNLARVHSGTALADMNWVCDADDGIYHSGFYNGNIIIGGWFSTVNGQPAPYYASIDTTTLQQQTMNVNPDGFVRTFTRYNDDFFVAGMFSTVNAVYRPHLLAYDAGDNAMDTWAPFPDEFPVSMQSTATQLFVGGPMTTTGGRFHPYFQVLQVQWVTAIDEPAVNTAAAFTVFPNPSSGIITVSNTADFNRYVLTDITGQVVLNGAVNASSLEIFPGELAPGMYVLTLLGETVAPASQTIIRR